MDAKYVDVIVQSSKFGEGGQTDKWWDEWTDNEWVNGRMPWLKNITPLGGAKNVVDWYLQS